MRHLLLTMMGCVLLLTQIGCTALEVESGDQNRHVFRARNFSGAKHKVAVSSSPTRPSTAASWATPPRP